MKITRIRKRKKGYALFVDNEYKGIFSEKIIIENNLYEGKDIEKNFLEKVLEENEKQKMMDYALNLLSKYPKTRKKLAEKLKIKQFDNKYINEVISKLEQEGYINDLEYAKNYIADCLMKYGKRKIMDKLLSKGIKKEIIDKALLECKINEDEIADTIANKWIKSHKNIAKEKIKHKLFNFLIQRGINYQIAKNIVKNIDFLNYSVK